MGNDYDNFLAWAMENSVDISEEEKAFCKTYFDGGAVLSSEFPGVDVGRITKYTNEYEQRAFITK